MQEAWVFQMASCSFVGHLVSGLPSCFSVFVFSDGTKSVFRSAELTSFVFVFSDGTMAQQHLLFCARGRVCLF
jgi:hypothetical protein